LHPRDILLLLGTFVALGRGRAYGSPKNPQVPKKPRLPRQAAKILVLSLDNHILGFHWRINLKLIFDLKFTASGFSDSEFKCFRKRL